ncbi:MAG: ABC transporter substrate-binding protein [Acidisphaera sp.]|nr:ABC transporter substrate-binding protein [Acidisphaera sp.]MBV9812631.1 ABC transporter substrate-binding protein [Acetobacteraceae bacterium]
MTKPVGVALALALAASPVHAAGTLTVAQVRDPGSWDPIATFLIAWGELATNVFDGLTQRGPDLKLQPGLAESWDVAEDGKRIRFHLRHNVTFQNGEPFDADAVKFTFTRLLGPEGAKGPQQSNYTAIGSVEIADPYTVDLVLKQPDPVLLTKLAGYGGAIVPPKYVAQVGAEEFARHPIGTGPFKVTDYQPKVSATMVPFAGGWAGTPKLDQVTYRFIVEPDTQVAELQAGRVDIAADVPISALPIIRKDAKLRVDSVTGPTVTELRFNIAHGASAKPEARRAMVMAVDRDAIIKTILGGEAKPVASFQGPLSLGYDANLKPLPFDLAGARALLKKAGVAPNTPVEIDFPGNAATFREVAQAVAGYLTAAGLQPSVKPYEQNIYTNDVIPNGKTGDMFQFGWGGWTFDYDNTAYLLYHSGEHWNPYVKDPQLDAMLEHQRTDIHPAEREHELQAIAKYIADGVLDMPLYNQNTLYGVNKRVQNFVPPPDNRFRFTDVTVQ